MLRRGNRWRITPCGLPIASARLLHSKGRIQLLHGEEFGIKVNAYYDKAADQEMTLSCCRSGSSQTVTKRKGGFMGKVILDMSMSLDGFTEASTHEM